MTEAHGFEFPVHWSESAQETVAETLSARPDLGGADLGALEQAAELVTLADALTKVAADAGYVSRGDAGQETTHRAVTEARLARAQAASILARLTVESPALGGTRSAAGRALARKRWSA